MRGAVARVAILWIHIVCSARTQAGKCVSTLVGEPRLDDVYARSISAQYEVHRRSRARSCTASSGKAWVPIRSLNPVSIDGYAVDWCGVGAGPRRSITNNGSYGGAIGERHTIVQGFRAPLLPVFEVVLV